MKKVCFTISVLVLLVIVSSAPANQVPNGDFESWTDTSNAVDWTASAYSSFEQSTDAYSGDYAAIIEWTQADNGININDMTKGGIFTLVAGKTYTFSLTYKPLAYTSTGIGDPEMYLGIVSSSSGDYSSWASDESGTIKLYLNYGEDGEPVVGDDYVTIERTFVAPTIGGTQAYRIYMLNRYWRGAKISLDDVSITVVPEPATLCLLACGSLVIVLRRKHAK